MTRRRRRKKKNMTLLVLGNTFPESCSAPNYRGTYRGSPPYCEYLPEDSEYNQLAIWYWEVVEAFGVRDDLGKTSRLFKLLRDDLARAEFELIEAKRIGEKPRLEGLLLGYDLSWSFSISLLSWGLNLVGIVNETKDKRRLNRQMREELYVPLAIRDLIALVEAHFKPMLNEHCLFSDVETAQFCLRSMMALQTLRPNLWEGENATFEVVALYKVPDELLLLNSE